MDVDGLSSVVADTSACICFLDRPPGDSRHELTTRLFGRVQSAGLTVLVSPITVAELLVLPVRLADVRAEAMVRLFITRLCTVAEATAETASHAAELRARYRLRTPDAFVLAAAREHAVDAVVGNDATWKRVDDLRYIHIDDEAPAAAAP